jgi:hypothetical protein
MMFDGLRRRAALAFAELTAPRPAAGRVILRLDVPEFDALIAPMPEAQRVILNLDVPEFEAMKLVHAMRLHLGERAEIERLTEENFELADIARRQAGKIEWLEGELLQMARA